MHDLHENLDDFLQELILFEVLDSSNLGEDAEATIRPLVEQNIALKTSGSFEGPEGFSLTEFDEFMMMCMFMCYTHVM